MSFSDNDREGEEDDHASENIVIEKENTILTERDDAPSENKKKRLPTCRVRLAEHEKERFPSLSIKKCVVKTGYSSVWTATCSNFDLEREQRRTSTETNDAAAGDSAKPVGKEENAGNRVENDAKVREEREVAQTEKKGEEEGGKGEEEEGGGDGGEHIVLCIVKVSRLTKKTDAKSEKEKRLRSVEREINAYRCLVRCDASSRQYFVAFYARLAINAEMPALLLECYNSSTPLSVLMQRQQCKMHAKLIFKTIGRAVAACHACGVVHHDLKPANVLLRHKTMTRATTKATGATTTTTSRAEYSDKEEEHVVMQGDGETVDLKLIDFGLAQSFSHENCCAPCGGTPAYTPPEVLWNTRHCSAFVDQWSLGTILYELLVGKPLVCGHTMNEYRYAAIDVDVRREFQSIAGVDKNAIELLETLLDQAPRARGTVENVLQSKYFA